MKSESGHWYLMVISIVDYAIYYFDSHLNVDDVPIRCASMRTMCDTLMQMMSTSGGYVEMDFFRKMSDFHSWQLKEARGIPNTWSSHDSAVWVLNWLEMGAGFSPNHSGYALVFYLEIITT
ncbi:uncharacterized protein LOC130721877 isoform X2 [Lotus japonicus]|uniref:uncharacterized protein LOC130721877 isoform X2 n=1 Tax=Lotus japonicus TaxID=34305 RepID=UPI00258F4C89|nr:uncharacterized protein LOC130721877 isoform X2 [Lotus japonicus]